MTAWRSVELPTVYYRGGLCAVLSVVALPDAVCRGGH